MIACVTLAMAATCGALLGQNIAGTILGDIRDSSGAPVSTADVAVTNVDTNESTRTSLDASGHFEARNLKPGRYAVKVASAGFKTVVRENITVEVESNVHLDFSLQVGDTATSLTVTAEAPLVESDNSSLGQVIDNRQIEDLPTAGRSVFDLAILSAGVQANPRALDQVGAAANFVMSDISINGGRYRTNEYLLDGISIMLPENNNYALSPTPDGTQEFKVMTNSYGPQFGRSGGGVMNVVTKSGTNRLHGSVYEFFRDDRLKSNTWFSNATRGVRGPSHFNLFGASAGGPVIHNRTFFFAEYQGNRQRNPGGGQFATLPTAAERDGDFSQVRNQSGDPVVVYNLFNLATVNGVVTRLPFPNNQIPKSVMDPSRAQNAKLHSPPELSRHRSGGNQQLRLGTAVERDQRPVVRTRGPSLLRPPNTVRQIHPEPERERCYGALRQCGGQRDRARPQPRGERGFERHVDPLAEFPVEHPSRRHPPHRESGAAARRCRTRQPGVRTIVRVASPTAGIPGGEFHRLHSLGRPRGRRHPPQQYHLHRGGRPHADPLAPHHRLRNRCAALRPDTLPGRHRLRDFQLLTVLHAGPEPAHRQSDRRRLVRLVSHRIRFGQRHHHAGPGHPQHVLCALCQRPDSPRPSDHFGRSALGIHPGADGTLQPVRQFRFQRALSHRGPGHAQPEGRPDAPRAGRRPARTVRRVLQRLRPAHRSGVSARFRTVLSAGYGIFYVPRFGSTGGSAFGTTGTGSTATWVTTSNDGTSLVYPLSNPFPNGLVPSTATLAGQLQVGQNLSITDPRSVNNVYNQQWNFNIQRQIGESLLIEVGYAGNHGVHLPLAINFDQVSGAYLNQGAGLSKATANPFYGLATSGTLSLPTVATMQLYRPYPQYTAVSATASAAAMENEASSSYQALQVKVQKRMSHGVSFLLAYTDSKLIDNASGRVYNVNAFVPPVEDIYNLQNERSVSEGDISQQLVFSHSVDLPFGHGKRFAGGPRWLLSAFGDWTLSGTATFVTGFPLGLTSAGSAGWGAAVQRPNNNGTSAALSGSVESRLNEYFNTSEFLDPRPLHVRQHLRTLPGDVRGPGRRTYNLAVNKAVRVREGMSLNLRGEAYNLTKRLTSSRRRRRWAAPTSA